MKIRTSHTEPGSRLRQQRGASERRTDVPSRYVEVALATATALIRFAPACCAGAALRDRRVCSERLLLPSTWVGYGRGVQWPQVRRRPAQLARSVRSAGSAAVVFVTPRCRAALPRRVRPPVFVFVAARWWGQAAWSGQAPRPVGRRSSDERPEGAGGHAALPRRVRSPRRLPPLRLCLRASRGDQHGRSISGRRGGPRKARYAPA